MLAHSAHPHDAVLVVGFVVFGKSGDDGLATVERKSRLEGDGSERQFVDSGHAGTGVREQVDEQ